MSRINHDYQGICKSILNHGREYENKNRGVKRLQIPSHTYQHPFEEGFPALSNKDLYWKGIVLELLWFLRGQTNIWYLKKDKVDIWDKDAYNQYTRFAAGNRRDDLPIYKGVSVKNNDRNPATEDIDSYSMFTKEEFVEIVKNAPSYEFLVENYSWQDYVLGDVGKNYSYQWRNFNGNTDQIKELIEGMRADIMSSRLKVNSWNPAELEQTALPPCHSEFQVVGVPLDLQERARIFGKPVLKVDDEGKPTIVGVDEWLDEQGVPKFGFELHWNQRSVDTFLGLPFNIASYGLLAKILEHLTGFPALGIEGTLKCVHFYDNQYDAAKLLLGRDPSVHGSCTLKEIELSTDLEEFLRYADASHFVLDGYTSDEAIKVEMLAPKE